MAREKPRYHNGIANLFTIYIDMVDICYIFDNSEGRKELIAQKERYKDIVIYNNDKFNLMKIIMKDKITKKEGLKDKLLKGLSLAYERMIAQKRKNNQKIVIKKGGIIATITP